MRHGACLVLRRHLLLELGREVLLQGVDRVQVLRLQRREEATDRVRERGIGHRGPVVRLGFVELQDRVQIMQLTTSERWWSVPGTTAS